MQFMAARDREGSSDGLYVAAWGSHNAQSHNHNDVGNVVVFVDGAPVLVDVGRPTYTSQTFSRKRYDIWAMQSAYHNLPTVNGWMQKDGAAFRAKNVVYQAREISAALMMDIAPAYPAEAGIREWTRIIGLERGRQVTLSDAFVMRAPTRNLSLTFMTPCDVSETDPGTLRLECARHGGAVEGRANRGEAWPRRVRAVRPDRASRQRSSASISTIGRSPRRGATT